MPGPKPKLAVTTPVTASFPSEISALSASSSNRSPLSAMSYPGIPRSAGGFDVDQAKTPISPPTAYSEFLRFMSLNSPMITGKSAAFTFSPTSAPSSAPSSGATTPNSAPSTAASDCSCKDADVCSHTIKQEPQEEKPVLEKPSRKRRHPDPIPPPPPTSTKSAPLVPPSPFDRPLLSAPSSGVIPTFPSLHIPPSPALCLDSPLTGTTAASATRSPYSSRSIKSPFDWEAALKARRFETASKPAAASTPTVSTPTTSGKPGSSKTTVRHIREVVTRTVTYMPKNTPKMEPAPKGKRRKVE